MKEHFLMNTYTTYGRVAGTPQLTQTQGGTPRLTVTIISNTRVKEGETYLSHSVNALFYGSAAELLSQKIVKGTPLVVSGEMATRKYVDGDGEIRYYEFLKASTFDFIESKALADIRKADDLRKKKAENLEEDEDFGIGRDHDFDESQGF